jgi:hypothetical protein
VGGHKSSLSNRRGSAFWNLRVLQLPKAFRHQTRRFFQWVEPLERARYFCTLIHRLFDSDKCTRKSCLDCDQVTNCNIFRAQYERKKASIQESRYEEAKDMAEKIESKILSMTELEAVALPLKEHFIINGRIDAERLGIALSDLRSIKLSRNRRYQLKTTLEVHHPELLEQ